MSRPKHTPGPWFIASRSTDDGLAVIEDGRQHGLHQIKCEWTEAYLIAAAPDMYEILKTLADDLGSDWKFTKEHIREVLAKAEGDL